MSVWEAPSGERQAWPEPPKKRRGRKRFFTVLAFSVAAVLLGAGGLVFALTGRDHSVSGAVAEDAVHPYVSVEYDIVLSAPCDHTYEDFDGYSDIDIGASVDVFDGSGNLLGFGYLATNAESGSTCRYEAAPFTVLQSDDGIYRVTSGNENRGYLNYTERDIIGGTLYVSATLG